MTILLIVIIIFLISSPFLALYLIGRNDKSYNPNSRGAKCIECGKYYDECGWCGTNSC